MDLLRAFASIAEASGVDGENLLRVAAVHLQCVECERVADDEARRWRMNLVADPDDATAERVLATYCPACAVREFGPSRANRQEA